jgi:hypothetical protein
VFTRSKNEVIRGFCDNGSSYCSVLNYDTVQSPRWLTMFMSHILPSSSVCSSEIFTTTYKTKQYHNSKDNMNIFVLLFFCFLRHTHDSHNPCLLSIMLTVPICVCIKLPGQSSQKLQFFFCLLFSYSSLEVCHSG